MELITNCDLFTAVEELNEAVVNNLNCCKKSSLEKALLYSKIIWLTKEQEDATCLYKNLYEKYKCIPTTCSDTIILNCVISVKDETPILTFCGDQIVVTHLNNYETS